MKMTAIHNGVVIAIQLTLLYVSTTQGFMIIPQQHAANSIKFCEKVPTTCVHLLNDGDSEGINSSNGSSNSNMNAKETSTTTKRKRSQSKQQQKKRRFAQDVKPIVSIPTPVSKPPPRTKKITNNFDDEYNFDPRPRVNKRNNQNNNNRNGPKNNDVLQNTKSIDELESIMSNRWGTGLEKWTADFDQWEVVYDDDDGNNNNNSKRNGSSSEQNSNPFYVENKSVKSGRKMNAKPVLNPWEKEEQQNMYNDRQMKKKNKKDKFDGMETNASSLFQSAKDRQDAVLDRVRKNQERLRQQKNDRNNNNVDGRGKNVMKNNDDRQSRNNNKKKQMNSIIGSEEFDLEFYDEDDEGYEASSSSKSSYQIYSDEEEEGLEDEAMDFYDNIISPTPVGGIGSSRASRTTGTSSVSEDVEQKSGFFFNSAAATEYDNEILDSNDGSSKKVDKKKRDEKKALRKVMVDDDGNEMYLTLEQATRMSEAYQMNIEQSDVTDGGLSNDRLSWDDIGITNTILKENLSSMNCFQPLSVQDKACPSIVTGNDVLISTHTGSGKTLAFLAPLAQRLLFDAESENPDLSLGVKVIVVAPGRELASQIVAVARDLFQGTGLSAMLAIGGTPFSRNYEQIRKKKPTFLIGTPGRIAELVVGKPGEKSGKLKIASLQTIVLDECDALLEYKPHREPTAAIMDVLKRRHRDSLQSILCSATAGDLLSTSKLDGYLRETYAHARSDENDLSITAPSSEKGSITRVSRTAIHGVVHVDHQRFALDMLRKILYTEPSPQQVLVFVDNARRVGIVVDKLAEMDIIAAPLHGGQGSEKGDRAEVNKALRDGFVGIVVATEMAARGIDAPYLTHVINLDLPTDASHYAHRAGRCGRGGRPGVVVNVAVGKREEKVPRKFAKSLNIDMFETETRSGKLVIVGQTEHRID